jgi:hypothetical protein
VGAATVTSLNMAQGPQPPGQGERVMALYSTRPSTSSGNRIMMQREARTPVFGSPAKVGARSALWQIFPFCGTLKINTHMLYVTYMFHAHLYVTCTQH